MDLVSYKVIGQFPIVDADSGAEVVRPNVVRLDPERTNIPALMQAGHLEPVKPAKKTT